MLNDDLPDASDKQPVPKKWTYLSPSPPTGTVDTEIENLNNIIQSQLTNGSWERGNSWLHTSILNPQPMEYERSALKGKIPNTTISNCWPTALTLAQLATRFPTLKQNWETSQNKALLYLNHSHSHIAADSDNPIKTRKYRGKLIPMTNRDEINLAINDLKLKSSIENTDPSFLMTLVALKRIYNMN